jgi:hypothetical protein
MCGATIALVLGAIVKWGANTFSLLISFCVNFLTSQPLSYGNMGGGHGSFRTGRKDT